MSQANELLKQNIKEESVNEEKEVDAIADLLADVVEKDSTDLNLPNPILDELRGMDFRGTCTGPVCEKDQELISSYLDRSDVRKLLPPSTATSNLHGGRQRLMVKL